MKKFFFQLVMFMAMCSNTWAQSLLSDPTKIYDTISDLDSCYLFYNPKPCFLSVPERGGLYGGSVMVQEYSATDSVTVYGVALTFEYLNRTSILDTSTEFQALLMSYAGISPINPTHYSMQLVDSVTFNRSHPRFCWFHYDNDKCNTASIVQIPCENHPEECSEIAPCYELYFDTPQQINVLSDTFYVGLEWSKWQSIPMYYGGRYSTSMPSHMYLAIGANDYGGYDYFFQNNGPGTFNTRIWGIAFPIIGFRCGPMKNYWLEEYGGNYAIMRWRSTEPGTLFNLRLVGEDGSDTTIVTQDTVFVFNWLSDSVRYNVMLRKQCHYCTSNYDTTVYGGWADTIHFGTTILPPQILWTVTAGSNNPQWGYASGSGVYPDSSTVTLAAISYNNHIFDSWNDGGTANPRQILVVSDTTFTAIFQEPVDTVEGGDTIVGGDTASVMMPAAEGFSLQPNPAHGTVHILLPTTAMGGRLSLRDVTGREVQACTVTSTAVEWDLSRLPVGTYLVKLSTPQGTATQKLVIQE